MSNVLKMAITQAILQLHSLHWSQRRIARELGVDRETVAKAIRQAQTDPKPAKAPLGSEGSKPASFAGSSAPAPTDCSGGAAAESGSVDSKPAKAPLGSVLGIRATIAATGPAEGRNDSSSATARSSRIQNSRSDCEPYREVVQAKLADELTAQRIYQDLCLEHGFAGSYYSVRRFVRRLTATTPLPFRRLECDPGFEAQVDYGVGAPIISPEGTRRKTHVFRIVLSHSRKGYCEVSYRQTTEDFLRALENAFWSFGGVPQTIVIDNLKAAVKHADWYDPELQPKIRDFCAHFQTCILPTKPAIARHKGKIERGVGYVQDNGLKGRTFRSLEEQNRHLADWEKTVADTRLHGTTRQQVGRLFEEVERAVLKPLPVERFAFFHEARRTVSRDGHVEVAKAFYSVPPEYLRAVVWVRWDARLVRVFNLRMQQLAVHVRREPGKFSTHGEHIAPEKISGVERGVKWLMAKVSLIGAHTTAWAEAMLCARGIQGTRVLMGVIALTRKHRSAALEEACKTALPRGEFRLRALRAILAQQPQVVQQQLPFLEDHPLIRPLDDYANVVSRALERQSSVEGRDESNGEGTMRFERHG